MIRSGAGAIVGLALGVPIGRRSGLLIPVLPISGVVLGLLVAWRGDRVFRWLFQPWR